ncbi:MAG TPA: hypothetical protein VGJ04_03980 [Pirellulales bacterium]|jgi:hypothetical protein
MLVYLSVTLFDLCGGKEAMLLLLIWAGMHSPIKGAGAIRGNRSYSAASYFAVKG